MPPTRFGHSCGHLQGGTLQSKAMSRYYESVSNNAQMFQNYMV